MYRGIPAELAYYPPLGIMTHVTSSFPASFRHMFGSPRVRLLLHPAGILGTCQKELEAARTKVPFSSGIMSFYLGTDSQPYYVP
jgi:hypothetical protein